jgi:hypothetical protein
MRNRLEMLLARAEAYESQRLALANVIRDFEDVRSLPLSAQRATINHTRPVPEAVSRFTGQITEQSSIVNNSTRIEGWKATLEDAVLRRTQALQLLDAFETQLEASGVQDLDKRIASASQKFDTILRS